MNPLLEQLKTLTSIAAVSGREDRLIGHLRRRIADMGHDTHTDRLGNLTVTFPGHKPSDCSLLIFAHMDELGLVVKQIEPNGFLRMERIGGMPEKTLRGAFVDVFSLDEKTCHTGVVGCYSHHITPADKKMIVPPISEMYIDLGCESRDEVLALGIRVGSTVAYKPTFSQLGQNKVTAKSLDNRMGVYILLCLAEHLAEHPPATTIHLCFSVQEEFNIRGCLPVFERLLPSAAICLDITPAHDTPELKGQGEIALGNGPAILYFNFHGRGTLAGLIPNPKLAAHIKDTAERLEMPYQYDVSLGVITDDAFTQLTGTQGVYMAHISVPCRYTHSPIETIDLRDLENTIRLCTELVDTFGPQIDLTRGI